MVKKYLLLLLFIPISVLSASGNYNDPATASGTNWTNPANVFLDDANRATYQTTTQDNLFVTDFSVGASLVATIDSIIVRINGYADGNPPEPRKIDVTLTKNGTAEVGDVVTVTLPKTSDGDVIVRGATDDLWGTTWTPIEINATTFGVTISKNSKDNNTLWIDHVQVQVWWSTKSVSLSNSTFAFGCKPLDTWLAAESTIVINNGTIPETFIGKISQFVSGSDVWTIHLTQNGVDRIRAQWSITSATGPWTNISAYDTDFTISTNVAVMDSVIFWFRIETPTSVTSLNQYSSILTVTAE